MCVYWNKHNTEFNIILSQSFTVTLLISLLGIMEKANYLSCEALLYIAK